MPSHPKAKPNPKPAPPSVVAQPSLKDQTEQHLTGLLEDHFSDVWDRVILKAGPEAQTGVLTFRAKLCLQGSVLRISHVMLGLSVKAGSSADGKFSHSYVLSLPEVYRDLEQGELFEEA
jgi:hypothetical protein